MSDIDPHPCFWGMDFFVYTPRTLTWNPKMEIWKRIFLFKDVIFDQQARLGSIAAYAQRIIAATPFIAESPYRKSHHVGSSVFDTLLCANFITRTTDVAPITQRHTAGLLAGLAYFSGKNRTMGLTLRSCKRP